MKETDFIKNLRKYADKCRNMYELCLRLGIRSVGGETYRQVKQIADENKILLIFSGEAKKVTKVENNSTIENILYNGSKITSNSLKQKLIDCGYKTYRCECCGNSEWMGKPIPLELHHINGNHDDNRLENLQILCRNCHGQTDNFCGKNTKKKRQLRHISRHNQIQESVCINKNYLIELLYLNTVDGAAKELNVTVHRLRRWLKKLSIHPTNNWRNELVQDNPDRFGVCRYCGKRFIKKASEQTFCSQPCSQLANRKIEVTKEDLINVLKSQGSFLRAAKVFNVSDKCVSKWCVRFGIPNKKKELVDYLADK